MRHFGLPLLVLGLVYLSAMSPLPAEEEVVFKVQPIGVVKKQEGKTQIVLKEKHVPGLLGLGDFSHVIVFYWFDRNDTPERRSILQVHPRGDKTIPLTGVFATRSPVRPNLIAFSVCKIVSVKDNVVEVESIDAFDETPVIDLKPYIPGTDSIPSATVPEWIKKRGK